MSTPHTPPGQNYICTGFRTLEGGMNGGISALSIPRTQDAYALNATHRGSFIKTRPKFRKITMFLNSNLDATFLGGLFQGACYYKPDTGAESLLASIAGKLYRFKFTSSTDVFVEDVGIAGDDNTATVKQAWLWQTERWVIWSDGVKLPVYWEGSAAITTARRSTGDLTTPAELPICRFGCYGLGRNWVALPDGRSFIAGDIVNWSSGTSAYQFRDAVLKASANQLISGGGSFVVPGSVGDITGMRFISDLDKSMGQGPLQVLTHDTVFSCNAPIDQSTWQFVTSPILTESLIGFGGEGHNSALVVNGDLIFRSQEGIRSLILGRREFTGWGNTPISTEVSGILDADDRTLLQYGSAIVFNNRLIMTAAPVDNATHGVYHTSLVVMDQAPVSSLRGKQPPVYDGQWTGLNVFQLVRGRVLGKERAFAFTYNATTEQIELWEILDDRTTGTETVTMEFHTAAMFQEDQGKGKTVFDACRLVDGEIYADEITEAVTFTAYYRPDYDSTWQPWFTWTTDGTKPYATRMGLGKPPQANNAVTGTPCNEGYSFQVKFVITGKCRVLGGKFTSVLIPQAQFSTPKSTI